MKRFRNLCFGLLIAVIATLALPSFASGAAQSDAEHAGYQGIPVRDGSHRGAIQQTNSAETQRYPSLPRRQNEIDMSAGSIADHKISNEKDQDRGGYRGIPRSTNSNRDDGQPSETPDPQSVVHPGYQGIPQSLVSNPNETQLATQRSSAFGNPK